MKLALLTLALCTGAAVAQSPTAVDADGRTITLVPGHASLQAWHIARATPVAAPAGNASTPDRVALGRQLFFDARVSPHGRTSCATCHEPARGFADGVPGSIRFMGEVMARNSPSIVDLVYRPLLMWDGRFAAKDGLGAAEVQAIAILGPNASMAAGGAEAGLTTRGRPHPEFADAGVARIRALAGYREQFARAYPGQSIDVDTVGKALAAFERSVVSEGTRFDRFVAGEAVMSSLEIEGLRVFLARDKGNCAACHRAPLFSDGAFHNIGLASTDAGRGGTFLTPPLRQVEHTAPYFHDGSARTLLDVVKHYQRIGVNRSSALSPLITPLALTEDDMGALAAFMKSLSSPPEWFSKHDRPALPQR